MSIIDNDMLWRQFATAIDSFGDALRACPDDLWEARLWADEPEQWVAEGFSAYWYLCYHTLFWLDLYLTGAEEGFVPRLRPLIWWRWHDDEALPRVYSRQELLGYLETLPPALPRHHQHPFHRAGPAHLPLPLGRRALWGVAALHHAPCGGTRGPPPPLPGKGWGGVGSYIQKRFNQKGTTMKLGAFSISLAVKDIAGIPTLLRSLGLHVLWRGCDPELADPEERGRGDRSLPGHVRAEHPHLQPRLGRQRPAPGQVHRRAPASATAQGPGHYAGSRGR